MPNFFFTLREILIQGNSRAVGVASERRSSDLDSTIGAKMIRVQEVHLC